MNELFLSIVGALLIIIAYTISIFLVIRFLVIFVATFIIAVKKEMARQEAFEKTKKHWWQIRIL